MVTVNRCGHLPHLEQAAVTAGHVIDFITGGAEGGETSSSGSKETLDGYEVW